jgi:hypothetical protein
MPGFMTATPEPVTRGYPPLPDVADLIHHTIHVREAHPSMRLSMVMVQVSDDLVGELGDLLGTRMKGVRICPSLVGISPDHAWLLGDLVQKPDQRDGSPVPRSIGDPANRKCGRNAERKHRSDGSHPSCPTAHRTS